MVTIRRAMIKTTCLSPGCEVLIPCGTKGYCPTHRKKDTWSKLDRRKAPDSAKFYGSYAWKKTRKAYKTMVPYCEKCKKETGVVKEGHTVHHTVERTDLEARGKSPFDFDYLEHVCFNCHQKELQKRRKRTR